MPTVQQLAAIAVQLVLCLFIQECYSDDLTIDPKGYVVYCPCMGKLL